MYIRVYFNLLNTVDMKKLETKFELMTTIDIITFFVIILFILLFAQSISALMEAFQSEVYTNVVAGISNI